MDTVATDLATLTEGFGMANRVNMEIFYWWCTAIMVCIHAGFLAYEMGASRVKNVLAAAVKNILAFAFLVPTFYLFGWWIYNALPHGIVPPAEGLVADLAAAAEPWSANMGPNLADNASGVFWAAFTMFAATTASILSGSVIERIRISAYIVLAVILGAVVWILGAAWGWHFEGWLTTEWGFHDTAAAGCVHVVAGFFTLGVLLNLGPRIGRFNADGSANAIPGHSVPMTVIGLMLIIVGFFGFLGGCIIYVGGGQWINIFGQPATLSSFAFNTLMGFGGGVIGAFLVTRDPFWMMSGALAGIISVASGMDLYYPPLAFGIAFVGGCLIQPVSLLLEKLRIDDAVGAIPVHGVAGLWSIVACGLFASGYPQVSPDWPAVSLLGQVQSGLVLLLLGFVPGYLVSLLLKSFGVLRVGGRAEELGLDRTELPILPYPEGGTPATLRVPAE